MPCNLGPAPSLGGADPGKVAVLYARESSIYNDLPGCDVWTAERDARKWPGGMPCVCHPPCRAWGKLRGMAKPRPDEKDLALLAISQARANGGVVEHPFHSRLWIEADMSGALLVSLPQFWFGHRAEKASRFAVFGLCGSKLPAVPFVLGDAARTVESMGRAERERTPLELALWLVETARRCSP